MLSQLKRRITPFWGYLLCQLKCMHNKKAVTLFVALRIKELWNRLKRSLNGFAGPGRLG